MKIAVIGIGYVGLSNAIVLAQKNEVVLVDIVEEKVNLINSRQSPIAEPLIEEYLKHHKIKLSATLNLQSACEDADSIISNKWRHNNKKNIIKCK